MKKRTAAKRTKTPPADKWRKRETDGSWGTASGGDVNYRQARKSALRVR